MKSFTDILLTIIVIGGILIGSAIITGAFTRVMYYRCEGCGNLNAKRRSHCRICGNSLRAAKPSQQEEHDQN
jgi:rRNA maturation endonuclease Nob1